jgi:hypothetical protein
MVRYRIRVQLVRWYELIVLADSPEEASSKVEALSPRQIIARGRPIRTETGLADPASLEVIARRR